MLIRAHWPSASRVTRQAAGSWLAIGRQSNRRLLDAVPVHTDRLARRLWHGQEPPAALLRRQPLQRGPVQDVEGSAQFPDRFGCYEDVSCSAGGSFCWYTASTATPASGSAPTEVDLGRVEQVRTEAAVVLERGLRRPPRVVCPQASDPTTLPSPGSTSPRRKHSVQRIPDQPVSQRLRSYEVLTDPFDHSPGDRSRGRRAEQPGLATAPPPPTEPAPEQAS